MQRNYIWNKAQASISRQKYYENRFGLNKSFQNLRDYSDDEEQNPNNLTYTQLKNRNKEFSNGYISQRPQSSNQRRILKLNHQSDYLNFPNNTFNYKQNRRDHSMNRQYDSKDKQLQFYSNLDNQYYQQESSRGNKFSDESFVTPQKTKEQTNNYYPNSNDQSMSSVKKTQYEKIYEEYISQNGKNINQNRIYEQERNQNELEPAQDAESIQEEANDQYMNDINEAYFSINDSNIHYSDVEQSFKESSLSKQTLNKKITGPSKLGEAKRRAISNDRNFIDNSYQHISNGNGSPINNSSWIFYNNKIIQQLKQNEYNSQQQLATFGYIQGDCSSQNNEEQERQLFQGQFDQQQNNNLTKSKIYQQRKQYELMLNDVKLNGARFYQSRPQTSHQQNRLFDLKNKNQIKYINQLSLPKYISDINDQEQFNYRKCGCGALEKIDSQRNLYKREGKCESAFYQNSSIRFEN